MDRWIDADDDIPAQSRGKPQGRVAALGMAGFVKSQGTLGTENAQAFGKIEVVQSKREQRKAEATRLMPPPKLATATPTAQAAPDGTATTPAGGGPPPVQSIPVADGPPKCPVPEWAGEPPAGSRLLVYKDGQVIQEVPLAKVVTVFGRVDALADVVLDHPSISRQHATAAYHPGRGVWLVTDLGSTHGTFVGGRQLTKNEPTELPPGTELRFAASTRRYKLPPPPSAGSGAGAALCSSGSATAGSMSAPGGPGAAGAGDMPPPPPPKRARVCFADDAADGGGKGGGGGEGGGGSGSKAGQAGVGAAVAAAGSRPRQLETVIGFSDGRDFAARVGPRAAAPAEGRFAAAVATTTIVVSPKRQGPSSASAAAGCGGAGSGEGGGGNGGALGSPRPTLGSPRPGGAGGGVAAAEVRPELKDFVERIRKEPPRGGGSLYGHLPPPSR